MFNEEMESHHNLFFTIIDGSLKYKNKERPKTCPIIICVLFYNSIQLKNKTQIIMA